MFNDKKFFLKKVRQFFINCNGFLKSKNIWLSWGLELAKHLANVNIISNLQVILR